MSVESQPKLAQVVAATVPGDPAVDDMGVIQGDYACAGCEYNLRTMHRDASCPECGLAISETVARRLAMAKSLLHLGRFSTWSRLGYAVLGIALPVVCFGIAGATPHLLADWQDGRWQTYVTLLYSSWSTMVFWPQLLYAMIVLGAVLVKPLAFGERWWARFGVYTGVVLAMQYLLILGIASSLWLSVMCVGCVIVAIGVLHGGRVMLARMKMPPWLRMWGPWVLALIALGLIVVGWMTLFVFVLLAPAWTLLVYVMMTLRIRATRFEAKASPAAALLLGSGWGVAYAGSWTAAVYLAVEAYATLPTSPPGCYIATAAARGHRRFVGSRALRCTDGHVMWVNHQLRTCKVAELALAVVCPRGHRVLRAIYDTLGPPLARRLRHPLAADVAFVLIVPFAWAATRLLQAMGCDVEQLICLVYPMTPNRML